MPDPGKPLVVVFTPDNPDTQASPEQISAPPPVRPILLDHSDEVATTKSDASKKRFSPELPSTENIGETPVLGGFSPKRQSGRRPLSSFPVFFDAGSGGGAASSSQPPDILSFPPLPPDFCSVFSSPRLPPKREDSEIIRHLKSLNYYPRYVKGARMQALFNDWQERRFLPESLNMVFMTNSKSHKKTSATSIYFPAETLEDIRNKAISRVVALDFDLTLTKKLAEDVDIDIEKFQDEVNIDKIVDNLKNAKEIQDLLKLAKERSIKVCVVTHNHNMRLVLAYLQTLVHGIHKDAKLCEYFSMVLCSPSPMIKDPLTPSDDTKGMKDGELCFLAHMLGVSEGIPTRLVDDETCNRSELEWVDFVQAPEDEAADKGYLEAISEFIQAQAAPQETVSQDPAMTPT